MSRRLRESAEYAGDESLIGKGKLLALILARGGSKRLPRKNILPIGGKPLIAWSIEAAQQSKYVDRVVVSSDDDEIAQVAREYGAGVPFIRPRDLAGDTSTSFDAMSHAIRKLEEGGEEYDYVLLLQPTSPLRNYHHIDEAVDLLKQKKADAIVGVTEVEHPVEWVYALSDNLSMDGLMSTSTIHERSQDLPVRYRINGAIYLCQIERMFAEKTILLNKNIYAYKMGRLISVDIDDLDDFKFAEVLMTLERKGQI